MYEVELKYALENEQAFRDHLVSLGATSEGDPQRHQDTYFEHPCHDFRETTEALRVRVTNQGTFVTYKGPKQPGKTKVREEQEWPLHATDTDGGKMTALFLALGFRPAATVRKSRETYKLEFHGEPVAVTIDQVDQLGWFTELEAIAADQAAVPRARQAVDALAREMGLSDSEPRSYLRMWLESQRNSTTD